MGTAPTGAGGVGGFAGRSSVHDAPPGLAELNLEEGGPDDKGEGSGFHLEPMGVEKVCSDHTYFGGGWPGWLQWHL